jgi:HSP20 family molecular chaperone IbpA
MLLRKPEQPILASYTTNITKGKVLMYSLVRRTHPVLHPATLARPLSEIEPMFREVFNNISAAAPYRTSEAPDGTMIEVNLAGFPRDAIEVTYNPESNRLIVTAEARYKEEGETKKSKKTEAANETEVPLSRPPMRQGFFNRSVNLSFVVPENIDADSITSEYTDGVLRVMFKTIEPEKKPVKVIAVS